MEKRKTDLPSWTLALSAAILLTGGWLMPSFPLLLFVGFAPLLALAEPRDKVGRSLFEKMEWVLLALAASLLAVAYVNDSSVVKALAFAIVYTLAFVAHAWVRDVLGVRTGNITLVLFWLALEYLMLKFIPSRGFFLADALQWQPDWTRWNVHTGYLGSSMWVWLFNLCVYAFLWQDKGLKWPWAVAALTLLGGPVIYSFSLSPSPITREVMINFYQDKVTAADVTYLARGEWVVRTAAWLSVLTLLFTFVRQQTRK